MKHEVIRSAHAVAVKTEHCSVTVWRVGKPELTFKADGVPHELSPKTAALLLADWGVLAADDAGQVESSRDLYDLLEGWNV